MRTLRLLVYLDMLRVKSSAISSRRAIHLSLQEERDRGCSNSPSLLILFIKSRRETERLPWDASTPWFICSSIRRKALLPDPSSSQVSLAYKKGARCLDGPLNPKATKSIHVQDIHFWATDSPPDIAACDHLRSMMLQIHPSLYPHHCTIPLTHP